MSKFQTFSCVFCEWWVIWYPQFYIQLPNLKYKAILRFLQIWVIAYFSKKRKSLFIADASTHKYFKKKICTWKVEKTPSEVKSFSEIIFFLPYCPKLPKQPKQKNYCSKTCLSRYLDNICYVKSVIRDINEYLLVDWNVN